MATIIVIHSLIITSEMITKTNAPQPNPQFPIQIIILIIATIVIVLVIIAYYIIKKRKIKEKNMLA
jgi:membrane protein DedA with SNARE-associated domain